jgi:hypothetical protein
VPTGIPASGRTSQKLDELLSERRRRRARAEVLKLVVGKIVEDEPLSSLRERVNCYFLIGINFAVMGCRRSLPSHNCRRTIAQIEECEMATARGSTRSG